MIKILLGIIVFFVCCCSKAPSPEANMEIAARAIIGIPPAEDLHVLELDSNFACLTFKSSPREVLSWIYRWPVTSDKFQHLTLDSFLEESHQLLSDKDYLIFTNNSVSYSMNKQSGKYSVECVIKLESKSVVRCSINCSKLSK